MTRIMGGVMKLAGRALLSMGPGLDRQGAVVATWDACVAALRDPTIVPEPRLNELASLLWSLVSSRVVATAAMNVPTLSFAGARRGDKYVGLIAFPENWLMMFARNQWRELGAVVHAGSQARDFWNGRMLGASDEVLRRARAHEAVFLHLARADASEAVPLTLDDYQRRALEEFPSFPDDLAYESIPFDLARAEAEFVDFSGQGLKLPSGIA